MDYSHRHFEQIYKSNYAQMYRVAYCIVRVAEDARDAVSQVFAQMWQNKPEVNDAALTGYLLVATRNQCLHSIERRQRHEDLADDIRREQLMGDDPQQEALIQALQQAIRERLTPQDQRVLQLHFDQEMTYQQTAQTLGISESAVNKHISQSLSKLRLYFGRSKQK